MAWSSTVIYLIPERPTKIDCKFTEFPNLLCNARTFARTTFKMRKSFPMHWYAQSKLLRRSESVFSIIHQLDVRRICTHVHVCRINTVEMRSWKSTHVLSDAYRWRSIITGIVNAKKKDDPGMFRLDLWVFLSGFINYLLTHAARNRVDHIGRQTRQNHLAEE